MGCLGGHKFKSIGKLSNGWTDCHKCKSGKAAKRLDRLITNLVHVCGFIWEQAKKTNLLHYTPGWHLGGGVLGGQQFKRLGNVVKRLDRLEINCAHIMQINLGMDTG